MSPTLRHCLILTAVFLLADTTASAQVQAPDTTRHQGQVTIEGDTLREIVVGADRDLPVEEAIRRSLGNEPRQMSLGDVLERLSPGINDKITHPFAIKQRKQERRHRRWQKRIEEFDQVRTFDELLREAYIRQMHEDSIAALKAGK